MRLNVVLVVLAVASAASGQERQRPRVALLPLELPASKFAADQKELDDFWVGLVSRTKKVELATPDTVRGEFQRKFKSSCPDNDLFECLAWIAEHSSSTYAVHVQLRKQSPREWQLTATIGAKNKAEVAQPVTHTFTFLQSAEVPMKVAVKHELELYLQKLDLDGLPVNPGAERAAAVTEVKALVVEAPKAATVEPPVPTPTLVVMPVVKEEATPGMKYAGYALVGVGVAAAIGGGVLFATAGRIEVDANGNVLRTDAGRVAGVQQSQTLGVALMGGGVGLAVLGGVLWSVSPSPVKVTVAPTVGGASLVLGGSFP